MRAQFHQKLLYCVCELYRYLELGKNESLVRSQDYLALIIVAGRNPIANPIVWDFVR